MNTNKYLSHLDAQDRERMADAGGMAATPPSATFRLPSTALFLGLMPVFSGMARRADLAALVSEPEPEPQAEREGRERRAKVRTYIVHTGRDSQARTSITLFDDDPLWSEGELSTLIKRQFGSTGLKHLLGVMIAAEEQSHQSDAQPGSFIFDANRHLDILGYSRANRVNGKGYHTARHLKDAREIVTLLCSLTIVQEIRLGARRGATLKIRLLLDEASAEAWEETVADGQRLKERIVTNEKIFLRFNPQLFQAAAEGTLQTQHQYTLQLKKLARENARSQGLTLALGVHLPIQFRLNGCQPLKQTARSFLRMAGITEEEFTKYEQLERLENALRHMVDQGYLSSFETERFRYSAKEFAPAAKGRSTRGRMQLTLKSGASLPPEPLDELWQAEPPVFLRALLLNAGQNARMIHANLKALAQQAPRSPRGEQNYLPGMEDPGAPPPPSQLLKHLRRVLGFQQFELAAKLGVTQAAISMAESGKRPKMAQRLLDAARRMLPPEAEQFNEK